MEDNVFEEINDKNVDENYSVKIVIVGDSGVGKSNIVNRFVKNDFLQDSKATVGVELLTKLYKINNVYVKIHLWDTAGQERYKSLTSAYYKGSKGAIIVFDITRKDTFLNVDNWFDQIREFGSKDIRLLIIGNKSDLDKLRAVTTKQAMDKAATLNVAYIETSALSNNNVEDAFRMLINDIYNNIIKEVIVSEKNQESINQGTNLKIGDQGDKKKKGGCCGGGSNNNNSNSPGAGPNNA